MSARGFLTRLLAQNERGDNVALSGTDEKKRQMELLEDVATSWRCKCCRRMHDESQEAISCCSHEPVKATDGPGPDAQSWRCVGCGMTSPSQVLARGCCEDHDFAEQMHICPECNDAHDSKQEAADCCEFPEVDGHPLGRVPQCMVCMRCVELSTVWPRNDPVQWWVEAAKCCLPVKSEVLTTEDCEQVGTLLAHGSTWVDAVAQVEARAMAARHGHGVH